MIKVKTKLKFDKIEAYLKRVSDSKQIMGILEKYGEKGVKLLADATPVDTGQTASSWSYEVTCEGDRYVIAFDNSNVNKGVPIAIILQYGHGTRTGGYVKGRDYINPALKTVFNEMQKEITKEVGRL